MTEDDGLHCKAQDILPLSTPAKRFRFERYIKTLSRRIMTTNRLLIAIKQALPNWPSVDYRKESSEDYSADRY